MCLSILVILIVSWDIVLAIALYIIALVMSILYYFTSNKKSVEPYNCGEK